MGHSSQVVRQARGGDRWFPGAPRALRAAVEDYIAGADMPPVQQRIVSAIAPHAGYMYSGKIAGYTFRALREHAEKYGEPDTVVVLGLSHRKSYAGIAVMDGSALETPLGAVAIDQEAAAMLASSNSAIFTDYGPHNGEHSAENQVPFVQVALPGAKLVVALTGDHNLESVEAAATALQALAKQRNIICIASTDLLHDASYDLVTQTDHSTLALMQALDYNSLWNGWDYRHQLCCGVSAVCIAMRFAELQGCKQGTILQYRNSGDDFPEGRGEWVVGYGAAVFTK